MPRVTAEAKDISRRSLFRKCLELLAVRFGANRQSSQRHNEHGKSSETCNPALKSVPDARGGGGRVDRDMAVARKFRRPFMQIIGGPQG